MLYGCCDVTLCVWRPLSLSLTTVRLSLSLSLPLSLSPQLHNIVALWNAAWVTLAVFAALITDQVTHESHGVALTLVSVAYIGLEVIVGVWGFHAAQHYLDRLGLNRSPWRDECHPKWRARYLGWRRPCALFSAGTYTVHIQAAVVQRAWAVMGLEGMADPAAVTRPCRGG